MIFASPSPLTGHDILAHQLTCTHTHTHNIVQKFGVSCVHNIMCCVHISYVNIIM